MIAVALILLIWLWGTGELIRLKPLRSRPDVWPLVLLWPLALAGIIGILVYELLYRGNCWLVARIKAVRS